MLLGLHHVTALAGDPQRNLDFYIRFLGLRLVKRTVNFDDPAAYHFYFGATGLPGSLVTFFPWPRGRRGQTGSGQITAAALRVASVDAWKPKAVAAGIVCHGCETRFGERVLTIVDPDGILLELVEGGEPGLHSVTLAEPDAAATGAFLQDVLGFSPAAAEGNRARFTIGDAPGCIDVLHQPGTARGRMAVGSVHHIALRVTDEDAQLQWREKLVSRGLRVSPVKDRLYFHSIYFREPGGVLMEIATDGPGFTLDEPRDRLGERLCLPPWFEPVRESIQRRIPPVVIPSPEDALAQP